MDATRKSISREFERGDFIIEILTMHEKYEGWIYLKDYGLKMFALGIPKKSNENLLIYDNPEELLEMIENDLEDFFIPEYKKLLKLWKESKEADL